MADETTQVEINEVVSTLSIEGEEKTIVITEEPELDLTTIGIQGPPGVAGPVGSSGSFTFDQAVPASVWTINHPLSKMPAVAVVDSAGNVVEGDIQYVDQDQVIVTFNATFSGKAYLN